MSTSFYSNFLNTEKFYYDFNQSGDERHLVITNPAGNKIFYTYKMLGTSETSKLKTSVYPNPATDIVVIENLRPNSSLELIDNTGKY